MGKTTSWHQNDGIRLTYKNVNLKCKWAKCPNPKTQTSKFRSAVFRRHISCAKIQSMAQNQWIEEDLPSKWKEKKKAGVTILVSDKTDFKPAKIKKDKKGHYIMINESMQQEEPTILNIYSFNTGAARFMKQVLRDPPRDLDSTQ